MKSLAKWALIWTGSPGFLAITLLVTLNVTAGEPATSGISMEEVYAMCQRSPEEAGKLAEEWMERGKFPTNFEWDAALLFLRKVPDAVSKPTLSNVLSRIGVRVQNDHRSEWGRVLGNDPIHPLLSLAWIRLRNGAVTNAISDMLCLYETNRVGSRSVPYGFLQNEIVGTMLAHGVQVPETFRRSPEYIFYEVFRSTKELSPKDMLGKCFDALWVPRRRPGDVIVADDRDLAKAESQFRRAFYGKIFLRCACERLLLEESAKLAAEARSFIEGHDQVPEGDEGAKLAVQMVWAYIIVARALPKDVAVGLLKKVEHSMGEKRSSQLLTKYRGAIETASELWWFKKCAFPSLKEDAVWGIYEYACPVPE